MPSCAICKKSVTTGIVLCGHCAESLEPYTLPADLAWFMSYLAEEIVRNDEIPACALCALRSCSGRATRQYAATV